LLVAGRAGVAPASPAGRGDLRQSAAVHLGGVPEYGSAPGSDSYPDVAFGDGVALVVWEAAGWENGDIHAARISGGTVMDPAGFSPAATSGVETSPSCAFGGGLFLVVWQDSHAGILAARVDTSGAVLGGGSFTISGSTDAGSPCVVSSDSLFLVVWHEGGMGETNVLGARVRFSGEVLDPDGFVISGERYDQSYPSAASDGRDFLVVWQDRRIGDWAVYGTRVTGSGSVQDGYGIMICGLLDGNPRTAPDAAFCGTCYVVAWQDTRPGLSKLYGTRVSLAGTVKDGTGLPLCATSGEQSGPALSFNGSGLVVAWVGMSTYENVMMATVDTTLGGGSATAVCVSAEPQLGPSVCLTDGAWMVVWMDSRSEAGDDVYATRVSYEGNPEDPCGFLVSAAANSQESPRAAFNGTVHLVVWEDHRAGDRDVYATRVSAEAEVLDSLGITVASFTGEQHYCDVTSNGSDFLVVWVDEGAAGDVYGRRVSGAGAVLDATPIAISAAGSIETRPSVASDGSSYFCVWEDLRTDGTGDIYGARVSDAGLVLDASGIKITINGSSYSQRRPSVCFLDTCYVVVWEDNRNGDYDVYAARVTGQGVVLDSWGIRLSVSIADDLRPSVTPSDTTCLAVWEAHSSLPSGTDVRGVRLSASGKALAPSPILVNMAAGEQSEPCVAFGELDYACVWTDARSGGYDIYGVKVQPDGSVVDAGGAGISKEVRRERTPSVSHQGQGIWLVVWSAVTGAPYEAPRIWGKVGVWDDLTSVWPPAVSHLAAERRGGDVRVSWVLERDCFTAFRILRQCDAEGEWSDVESHWTDLVRLASSGTGEYVWFDEKAPAELCRYALSGETENGVTEDIGTVTIPPLSPRPAEILLAPPTPNPAVLPCRVEFRVAGDVPVTVDVVDVRGNVIRRVFTGVPGAERSVTWDGTDWRGRRAGPGIYFIRLTYKRGSERGTERGSRRSAEQDAGRTGTGTVSRKLVIF
ncbi:MAG: FlgD immunoglobulin-like domain containing protein, partial [Candidatus Eisenbacteria bacterium]